MKTNASQKPNLKIVTATVAKKIFVRPGMMFRPE